MTEKLKRILITEDEKPIAHAMQLKLTHSGFDATVASNGQEALDILSKESYDMILLDLVMPIVDGFGVLEELQKRGNKTPVMVLSNLSQPEDEKKVKALGAVDFFVKSNVPLTEIVKRVTKQLA